MRTHRIDGSASDRDRPRSSPAAPGLQRPATSAVLGLQQAAGNRAVLQLLRGARANIPEKDMTLSFSSAHGAKPVTLEALADWVNTNLSRSHGELWLEEQLLGSQEFTGSVAGRRYWANYLRENLEVLLAISAEHLKTAHERAQKQVEAERRADAQILVDAFSKKTYEGDYRFGVGFFHAVYDPSVGTLTVTVPVRFDFKDSDSRSVKVTNAGKPDQKVEFVTEHLNWGSDNTGRWESEVWKEKFIGLVQPFWSRHVLACSRPGWESLRARVVVRVDDVPLNEPRPGIIEPRLVNVYRGDTPSGTEFVTKGSAELSYADVDPMFPGLHPVAVHEFGHMLGFDDEYAREGFPAYALHSDLVKEEFGYGVPRLDESRTDVFKDSIMSSGMGLKSGNVLVEHGVLFLAALRQISGIREWKLRLQ